MVVTLAWMASIASMVASMASMVWMTPMAAMVLASAALKAPMAGVTALRRSKLRNEMLVCGPEELLVRRWSYNSGVITVLYELGQNSSKIWLCPTAILAEEDDGSRCSRRVDDAKVKKELMGCQLWALAVTMAWVASMASMVWMAQGVTDVEVPLVASMVGVDGGLGSSTQRALTWKSLCVPSSEGDTHSGSLLFV